MKKSISVNKKSRGRPKKKGGVYPVSAVRLSPEIGAAVDDWAATNEVGRSEAIRRLVEIGLTVKTKAKQAPVERATRARELAAKTIEKISDPSATQEERIQRRRRLTRGPQEFREDRVDLPETKRGK
jgi:hypothetical protein